MARIESKAKGSNPRKRFKGLDKVFGRRATEKYIAFGLILILMFSLSLVNNAGALVGNTPDPGRSMTQPALLFIYADWCPYCQREKPIVDDLERVYSDVVQFIRINGPEQPQIASHWGVEAYPSIFLLSEVNGNQYIDSTFVGFTEADSLKASLDDLITAVKTGRASTHPLGKSSGDTLAIVYAPVEICDWQGCSAGAVSISEDDNYSYCRQKLNINGFKGTFYLNGTKDFSEADWVSWREIVSEGHEVGGHTQSHFCIPIDDDSFRYELSSNKNDIVSKLNVPAQEVSTLAWPCGYSNDYQKQIAQEYYIAARGYLLNELEDKNPADWMELKSINTPHYHDPKEDLDLSMVADMAESEGKWVNYVFHNSCEDDGVIASLPARNLWVAPVGTVVKYIIERQNTQIKELEVEESHIRFNLINNQDHTLYNQELTIRVSIGQKNVSEVKIDNSSVPFTYVRTNGSRYIKLNLLPTGNNTVTVATQTTTPVCGNGIPEEGEDCDDANSVNGDGCNSVCRTEDIQVYLAPYIGDIDGSIDSEWLFFYDQLRKWHDDNNIPVAMSFYPTTMNDDQFNQAIADMYDSRNVELVIKGEEIYDGKRPDLMSYYDIRALIQGLQDKFVTNMKALGYDNVKAPVAFNLNQARFTDTVRDAVHDLGFEIYFEQYVSEYGNIDPLPDFDVMQYTISFTRSGHAGPSEVFKQQDEIEKEIMNFQGDSMLYINGIRVVSLMAHQQDFRTSETSSTVDQDKWNTYTSVLQWAKDNPKIQLLTPEQIFDLRHLQKPICQYASTASATSEDIPVSLAAYATGAPDAPTSGNCSDWSGPGYTWTPQTWDIVSALTLTYKTPVYPTHFIVYGDQDMCWDRIWLKNSATQQQFLIFEGIESSEGFAADEKCISTYRLSSNFIADTIILETCGWSWSATDAVQLCGNSVVPNVPAPTYTLTPAPTPMSAEVADGESMNIWVIIGPILAVLIGGVLIYSICRMLWQKAR